MQYSGLTVALCACDLVSELVLVKLSNIVQEFVQVINIILSNTNQVIANHDVITDQSVIDSDTRVVMAISDTKVMRHTEGQKLLSSVLKQNFAANYEDDGGEGFRKLETALESLVTTDAENRKILLDQVMSV